MTDAEDANPDDLRGEGVHQDGWRIIAASVRGPAHASGHGSREDDFAIRVAHSCAIAVVCDGAGTAAHARRGAEFFSKSVMDALVEALVDNSAGLAGAFRDVVIYAVEKARQVLSVDGPLNDYHATLLAVVATASNTLVAHVGDGLAGVAAQGEWETALLSKPENGEFANETYFVTSDNWQNHLRCVELPSLRAGGAAVAMTDGAMPFVINTDDTGLEKDFMEPVNRFLLSEDVDHAASALVGTLNSAGARKISADDKTFVWIALEAIEAS